jgi:hypothetical protein
MRILPEPSKSILPVTESSMRSTTDLPLHHGKAPSWLTIRMKALASQIFAILSDEYDAEWILQKIADPVWFQCLCCLLGYDWHSSGTTTVLCGVLKSVDIPGVNVVGGKGKTSRKVPQEITRKGEELNLSTKKINSLVHASKMTAKVDNCLVQDGHQLYHHSLFFSESGSWTVVQQGMNPTTKYARRYQWSNPSQFIEEPHKGITGEKAYKVMDLTAKESRECRKVSLDVAKENPMRIRRYAHENQETLDHYVGIKSYVMPKSINWNALRKAYETQPETFEELISIKGMGPKTLRGLALVSEFTFGESPSHKDPVRFSFAFGGKDGVPFPVERKAMDEVTEILSQVIQEAALGKKDKLNALKRIAALNQ